MNKMDIPDGGGHDCEDTDLDLPNLPGEWRWKTCNHYHWNQKVNIYFGRNENEPGGWLGEIDNYIEDGEEVWDVHVRSILADGTETGRVKETADTVEQFDSLAEAIEAVPGFIATYYDASL